MPSDVTACARNAGDHGGFDDTHWRPFLAENPGQAGYHKFAVTLAKGKVRVEHIKGWSWMDLNLTLGCCKVCDGRSPLKTVRLDRNKLVGALPASLSNLSATVTEILLQQNYLEGDIPKEFNDLTTLFGVPEKVLPQICPTSNLIYRRLGGSALGKCYQKPVCPAATPF